MPRFKVYIVEFKFDKKWEFMTSRNTLTAAYEYISGVKPIKYPVRIIRVNRTIVFDGEK